MLNRANFRLRMLASAAAAAGAIASPAWSQTQAAASSDAMAATGLSEIVVTAMKRETDLQKTPIAISVVSSQALAERHVQSLLDLGDGSVPGLRIATFEARQSALTIGVRGIVPLDANQPAREQGVGVYIDGVYLGRQHGLNAALLDIDRIEVLKGPQGTLFGRNTEGGALSMVSRAPTGEFGLRTTVGVGNYGAYNGSFHLDLPAIANFSVKLDGAVQYRDPTVKNPLPGATGWNYFNRRGLRAAVRWQPLPNFTADYAYDTGQDSNSPFYSQLLNYNPQGKPIGTGSGKIAPLPPIVKVSSDRMSSADIGVPQQPSVDKTSGHSLHLKWKVSPDLELRSITAYREVSVEQWDNSGGAHRPPVFTPNGNFSRYSLAGLWQHQFSQEFQAVGSFNRVDYVAGLYYFDEKASDDAATPNTNKWNADGTGYTILDPTPTIRGSRIVDRASVAYATSYAVYGQATYTPAILDDRLHVTVGGRYTNDDKNGRLLVVNNIPRPYSYAEETSRFNPMATVAFDAAPGINVYAKYATGYRSGGASSRSITYRSFGPEDVKSYEIGAKTEFWDHRARLNVAAYKMDRKNSQIDFSSIQFDAITGTNRNTIETVNADGVTEIKGLEVDLTVNPIQGLSLTLGYAYTDTSVPPAMNYTVTPAVLQPVYIVFTPRNAVSGAIDYSHPVGPVTAKLHLDAAYADATQTFDQFATKADSSFIVNGRLSIADIDLGSSSGKLTVSVWARNLFDEQHVYRRDPSNQATLGDYGNFNEPRTFGIEGSMRF